MSYVGTQLEQILDEMGVRKFNPTGQEFDATEHEALEYLASDKPEGIVLETLTPGYMIGDRVVRPATVNGKDVTVGGSVSLTAGDVGAPTTAAMSSHTHTIPSAACKVVIDASTAWTGLSAEPGASYSQSYLNTMRDRINDLYDTVNAIAGNHYCDGCGKAGATSTP
jgi:hypothetical protein